MFWKSVALALFMLVASGAGPALAASRISVTGQVTEIKIFAATYNSYSETTSAAAYISVEGLPGACGGSYTRVAIGTAHPLYETVVSLDITAMNTGKAARITYFDECTIQTNAWDFADLTLSSR